MLTALYLFGMLFLLFLLSFVAPPLLAARKGYAWYLWTIAAGLIGLIVLAFLPQARADALSQEERRRVQKTGNTIGAILSAIGLLSMLVGFMYFAFMGLSRGTQQDVSFEPNPASQLARMVAGQLPLILAYLVGIVFAIVWWRQAPMRSMLVLSGCGLRLIVLIARWTIDRIISAYIASHTIHWPNHSIDNWYTINHVLGNLFDAIAWGLLIWAAFVARPRSPDEPMTLRAARFN